MVFQSFVNKYYERQQNDLGSLLEIVYLPSLSLPLYWLLFRLFDAVGGRSSLLSPFVCLLFLFRFILSQVLDRSIASFLAFLTNMSGSLSEGCRV